jgi:flagellar basal-body rod modification protein FlgD
MAIDAIGMSGIGGSEISGNTAIAQEEFMRILLTQLRFQDPLKPVDNQQFVAQLAQFSALEFTRQQNEKIDTLLSMNAASQAIGLLGQRVEVLGAAGAGVGEVTAISFATGEARLSVRTSSTTLVNVRLGDVQLIQENN